MASSTSNGTRASKRLATRSGSAALPVHEPIPLCTSMVAPPAWKSPEQALDYLGGDFTGTLRALSDLVAAAIPPPAAMLEDLATIAEALAAFLRDPAPLALECESAEYLEALGRCAGRLFALHGQVATAEGQEHEIRPESVGVLGRLLVTAALESGEKARRQRIARLEAETERSETQREAERWAERAREAEERAS